MRDEQICQLTDEPANLISEQPSMTKKLVCFCRFSPKDDKHFLFFFKTLLVFVFALVTQISSRVQLGGDQRAHKDRCRPARAIWSD